MKKSLHYLLPVLGLAVALPLARAAEDDKPDVKKEKKELRVIASPDHRAIIKHLDGGEKEPVTFLGIETAPVSPTLTAQLGLQDGAGLVVNHVVPDSPASGALKMHDILVKLDDQILIEQRQLSVLVRNHKDGDEVTLTYLRGGKQSTAKIKLGKHDLPKMALELNQSGDALNLFNAGPNGGGTGWFRSIAPNASANGDDADRLLGLINGGPGGPGLQRLNIARPFGSGDRNISVTVNTGNSHMVLDDDKGSLDLAIKDGKKELVAKNAKGEPVFSGPINTPEERKALPEDVRARLEKLEDSTQFTYKTNSAFKGETMIARPRGQGIAVPMPVPGRAPVSQAF